MRTSFWSLLLVLLSVTLAFAWEKEDHEIFDLVSALEAAEGPKTSFYSFLNLTDKATTSEIGKAYRKRSLELHPDKNPGVKNGQERFARLGVIAGILRDSEKRKRYDHFYRTGVPKWKGTGYMYSRYRPGLGAVLIGLTIMSSLFHYMIQHLTYRTETLRIKTFQQSALKTAWGPNAKPSSAGQRKKIRMTLAKLQGSEEREMRGGPHSGPVLDLLVEDEKVYLLDENNNELPLDDSAVIKPAFTNTWVFGILKTIHSKATSSKAAVSQVEDTSADDSSRPTTPIARSSTPTLSKSKKRKNAGKGI